MITAGKLINTDIANLKYISQTHSLLSLARAKYSNESSASSEFQWNRMNISMRYQHLSNNFALMRNANFDVAITPMSLAYEKAYEFLEDQIGYWSGSKILIYGELIAWASEAFNWK